LTLDVIPGRDIVIVGAGHNGRVTAFQLAKAGLKPLVPEARDEIASVRPLAAIGCGCRA
jgi:2-polyprenyl-6-methoxyphenol hydroxylase-like FAD-dependent oxidoreductase